MFRVMPVSMPVLRGTLTEMWFAASASVYYRRQHMHCDEGVRYDGRCRLTGALPAQSKRKCDGNFIDLVKVF